jgi:3-methyladenine DNA glycosylase AlkD
MIYINTSKQDALALQMREIKLKLRSVMNGVVSTSMQKRGLDYKLNYGVSVLILKDMAKNLPKDHLLAQLLWSKEVREMKILATMIQPTDQFTTPIANRWIESIVFADRKSVV